MVRIVIVYGLCLTNVVMYVVRIFVGFIYEIFRLMAEQPNK
jgi:hypothetical protein